MKKWKLALLAAMLCFGLTACYGNANETGSFTNSPPQTQNPPATPSQGEESTPTSTPDAMQKAVDYEITYSSAKTYTNSIGTTWVQAIFEVTNTGTGPLYLSAGSYDLEDESGALVASKTMVSVYPDVIDPGEKAYYYEESTLDDVEGGIELTILPRADAKEAKIDNIRFSVSDFSLSEDSFSRIKMMGRVENNSDEVQNMIYIAAILFDSDNKPIGQIFTILSEELAVGDKIGFEGSAFSLPKDVTMDAVARYEVFAYPLQFQF